MATQSDNTNTGVVTTIVVVGTFAMISISAMLTALVRSEHDKLDDARPTNADLDTVAALDRDQLARINAPPSWVSEPGGKVNIPIQLAMSVVVDEYEKHPEAASPPAPPGVNMTPQTTPAPGAAPAGSPAPGAAPAAAAAGSPQPGPAVPSPATPNPAAPDPATTPRVVPPPAAPGPPAKPETAPGTPPTTTAPASPNPPPSGRP
jgi:hypothetical protein